MDNIGRNIEVRAIIEKAFEVLQMIKDPLELWCIVDLAPEVRGAIPPTTEKLVSIELGPLTRNTRTTLHPDHLMVSLSADTPKVKLPYSAIYCMATSSDLAQDLNWMQGTSEGRDLAYVDLVQPYHGIPKYQQ
ncbi:hypothetical protein ST201phi2-1p349 [Pseudomonas phage 201phi2-1]|uniref:Uncharacterized protein n=1 Tax=Pseudomonas phage 201phi2-1 TaxID=198110 RepID=B3FJL0_BP201|nr:hypothetical protein ST201phi2-1p349 [Pseudomonas phage 201phi2-1]ABY63175.1 hypothetical protein 201phi2-1p349 [Pseudomonas phage 201phi2-1]